MPSRQVAGSFLLVAFRFFDPQCFPLSIFFIGNLSALPHDRSRLFLSISFSTGASVLRSIPRSCLVGMSSFPCLPTPIRPFFFSGSTNQVALPDISPAPYRFSQEFLYYLGQLFFVCQVILSSESLKKTGSLLSCPLLLRCSVLPAHFSFLSILATVILSSRLDFMTDLLRTPSSKPGLSLYPLFFSPRLKAQFPDPFQVFFSPSHAPLPWFSNHGPNFFEHLLLPIFAVSAPQCFF